MARERTYVMIKPDGVQRGLIGDVISRFERKGLQLAAMSLSMVEPEKAHNHYGFLKDKPFYNDLISFITSSPVVKMVWEGENAINFVRSVVGLTNPMEATPGTIRADYAVSVQNNIVHASDGPDTAEKEIANFFSKEELVNYDLCTTSWLGE